MIKVLIELVALGLFLRLAPTLLLPRNRIRFRIYEPLGSRLSRWGCIEWGLIGVALLTLLVLYLLGRLG